MKFDEIDIAKELNMSNVIQFPRKSDMHSVADALRACVMHSKESGVIDANGETALLQVLDTIEELWHHMNESD